MRRSSSSPPSDSPLSKIFLRQYVSSLIQETIKVPYGRLGQDMSISKMVLRDAVEGKLGLTRRQAGQGWSNA
jgi:hypothetical protein